MDAESFSPSEITMSRERGEISSIVLQASRKLVRRASSEEM